MASIRTEDIPQVGEFMRTLWPFMKAFWLPEDDESYWKQLIDTADELITKYDKLPIAKAYVVAFLEHQNDAWQEMRGRK